MGCVGGFLDGHRRFPDVHLGPRDELARRPGQGGEAPAGDSGVQQQQFHPAGVSLASAEEAAGYDPGVVQDQAVPAAEQGGKIGKAGMANVAAATLDDHEP